jgi:ribosome maturation factor RimP
MSEDAGAARIAEVVEPVLRHHGLELVDLNWRGSRPRGILRVFVDRPGGVSVQDCERVSRQLGDVLDVAGAIEGAYDLEVSSPGLDRLLRTERELRWAIGKPVRCWVAGGQEFGGRLVEVWPDRLVLERAGERTDVSREILTKARLDVQVSWARRT